MMLKRGDRLAGVKRSQQSIDSPSQDLQQLANTIKVLGFVNETQENVVDLFSYEGAQSQEFSVDTMKHSFEEVTFAWIFRVKQLQQLKRLD